MSNVQNGDRFVGDGIKNFEWISNQGHNPHLGTRGQTLTLFGITAIRATVARM
jgi:hypothetical protein